jgi:2-isopropylmalate synthase
MPVSTAQMEYFYHVKANVMQEKIKELISASVNVCENVEFVARDAFRAEQGFVAQLAKVAYEAGAKEMTICDDAGVAFPEDFERIVNDVKSVCDIKVNVQPSNALSLASACALSAIKAGADGVKTSVIGDYLSVAVLANVFRTKKFDLDADCDVDVTNVSSICSIINGIAREEVETVDESLISGFLDKNATIKEVVAVIKQLGYELSDTDNGNVYDEFKKLVAKKDTVDNKELEAIVASTAMQVPSTYHLVSYVVNSSNIIPATANITLEKDGEKFVGVSTGDGPIDAAFHAIEQIVGHHYELDDFQVHAVTKGRGAVGSSLLRLRANGKLYPGNGVSTDIVGACIRAYINALNKIVYEEK